MSGLVDPTIFADPGEAVSFISSVLEASTEYSIIGKDLSGTILLWNDGARRLYGYEASEVVNKQKSDILHDPADVEAGLPEQMREVALEEGKWEGTVARRRRDGGMFTARVVLTPRRNAQGEPIGFLLISKDISKEVHLIEELEAVKDRLTRSEALFRCLAEYAPIGIFSLDQSGLVSYANPRLRVICGQTRDAAVGGWADLIHPEDRDHVRTQVAAAIAGGMAYRDRQRIVRPDGAQRWVDVRAAPIAEDSGQVSYVGTAEDVTEMIEAQQERDVLAARLTVAERLESLGQLAAGVAHDFNNLLGVMINYAQFVADGLDELATSVSDPRLAELRSDITAIDTAARSAANLTHELLIFGRREVVHLEIVDPNELIKDTANLLVRTIGEHVRLKSRLAQDLWTVKADPRHLEQVIVNLVVNARDAISETGTVLITTDNVELDERTAMLHAAAKPGSYACIAVVDDGAGMTQQTIARAFEPFFTTKPRGKGTGLGLATVHGIVSQMGGYVGIYSEPGQGTAMRVYLPAAQGTSGAPTAPAEDLAGGHGEIVLVVEDDYAVRAVTTRILENYGYAVVAAGDGQTALAVLEDQRTAVDLLLTDVVMPTMSGREIAERASGLRPALPVLFMCGYAGGLMGMNVSLEGVDLLEKPVTRASLLSGVARALGSRPDLPGSLPRGTGAAVSDGRLAYSRRAPTRQPCPFAVVV
jgi:two-component system, cell cycle sensor histidine kinase and response regulator CckA